MAPIALVDIDAFDHDAGDGLQFLEHGLEGIPIVWGAMERLGVKNELTACSTAVGSSNQHLAAELIGLVRFALSDALDFRCMQGTELAAALFLLLRADLVGP